MGRKYTWAYINTTAEGDVAPAEGEFGSIQTKDFDGGFKGHANFRYLTSSTTAPTSPLTTHVVKLTGDFAMSGDIFCTGSIYARNYYIKNVGFMDLTGSTKFGDDLGDTHNFKGDVILDTTSKLYFHDEAGGENIYANSDGHLEINAGSILDLTAPTIDINGSTEVQIDAATFDVNGTTAVTIDCTDTSNGISIGTATSAVPISIGHTTSETTVNDNLTVTGDAEVTGDLTVTGESTFNDKVTINQDDGQQGLRINQTGDGIGLDIDASTVTGKAAVKVTTGRTSGGSGFYLNANSVTSGYGLGIDANGLNGANAAALYIQSEINAQQAGHLIRIKNTDDTNDQMQGITIENAAAPDGNYRDFVIKGLSPNDGMRFQADHEGVIVGPSTTRRGKLHIYSSTSDDIGAMIAINSDQAASDRKPQVAFFNSGARKFTVGSDGSDSMKFKMGTTAIDTGTFLEANTSGELIKLGDDTPALNDVLTWNGSKAIWEPNSLTSATQLVNNAGDAVISSVTDVEITLDSNDNSSTHNYFRIIDGDGQTTLSFGEQGQMVMRGLSGSATEGAKLFMSASNSDAANSAEITFRKTHFADGGTFSAGDNLGTLRFQGSDAGIPDTSSIVIVGEVAAGSIPDASAESWSQGAQMGAELKFSLKQTGTNNFNESLILDANFEDAGGSTDTTYYYMIRALNANFAESAFSNAVTARPQSGSVISLSGDLTFGDVRVNENKTDSLFINNTGNTSLSVSGISYPSGFSGDWSSGTISAGGSQKVTVTFAPTAVSNYSGSIIVTSDANSGTNTVNISGNGIDNTTGIEDLEFSNSIKLYPNPVVGDEVNIIFKNQDNGNILLQLLDSNGKLIDSYHFRKNSNDFEFDLPLANTVSGIYYIVIVQDNKKSIKKLIKK